MEAVTRTETEELAEHAKDSGRALYHLPEKPLIVIEPHRSWVALNLRDLWAYREVFHFLVWRDIKVRYKQTVFGVAWAIIQPLFLMLAFAFFFGQLVRVSSDGAPYPVWVYVGILPWTFFSNALANSGNSLIGNSNLITKVYFPRLIIPSAAIAAGLLDFAIAFTLLLGFIPFYGLGLSWSILMLPPLVLLVTLLALAVGIWTSALNARYRDVRHALPFMIQLWMFATPIIYPLSIVPQEYRWIIALNPLTGIVEGFRAALFGWPFDWWALAFSATITLLLFVFFVYVFRRMESSFADVI